MADLRKPEDKLIEFRDNEPTIYQKAFEITDKVGILTKIYDHLGLFRSIRRAKCTIFTELVRALFSMNSLPDDSLLIHFTEIDLYGIFTRVDYLDFIKNISEKIEDNEISGNINLYQIIISGRKQKLVFACTDTGFFIKLQGYARECFGKNVSKSNNQITVNVITANENEIVDNYNELYQYIYSRGDIQCADSMKQIQLMQDMQYKYRNYCCNDTLTAKTMEDLLVLLKSGHNLTINGPVVFNRGTIGVIGTQNNITTDKKQLATTISSNWIRDNPPNEKEKTTDYYKRYTESGIIEKPLADNQFGKLVRKEGYETAKGTNSHYWRFIEPAGK